jgi:hypothetical protein
VSDVVANSSRQAILHFSRGRFLLATTVVNLCHVAPLPIPYSSIGKVRARRAIHFYDFDGAKQDIGVAPRRTNRTSVKTISACNNIL